MRKVTVAAIQMNNTRIVSENIEKAEKLLSRPFLIEGRVQGGDHRGRILGFPTANFYYPDDLVIPRHGVYAAACPIDGRTYKAISYIGLRPTFSLERVIVETYLLDFEGDLYNKDVKVEFIERLRDEIKFENIDLGLDSSERFDLTLDTTITKLTVSNPDEKTETKTYAQDYTITSDTPSIIPPFFTAVCA